MNKELVEVHRELNKTAADIPKTVKAMDGWAARVLKTLHINDYANYPKRSINSF